MLPGERRESGVQNITMAMEVVNNARDVEYERKLMKIDGEGGSARMKQLVSHKMK